jgi:hypothetical protein
VWDARVLQQSCGAGDRLQQGAVAAGAIAYQGVAQAAQRAVDIDGTRGGGLSGGCGRHERAGQAFGRENGKQVEERTSQRVGCLDRGERWQHGLRRVERVRIAAALQIFVDASNGAPSVPRRQPCRQPEGGERAQGRDGPPDGHAHVRSPQSAHLNPVADSSG